MLIKQRKNRLYAFSSMFWLQMGPPHQTLRARLFWLLSALEKLESQPDFRRFPACSEAKTVTQNKLN